MDLISRLFSFRSGFLNRGQQAHDDAAERTSAPGQPSPTPADLSADPPAQAVTRMAVPVRVTIKLKPPSATRHP